MSVNEVEGLLRHALDAEKSDEMESAFSENGATEAVNIFCMIIAAFVVHIKFVVDLTLFWQLGEEISKLLIPGTFAKIIS